MKLPVGSSLSTSFLTESSEIPLKPHKPTDCVAWAHKLRQMRYWNEICSVLQDCTLSLVADIVLTIRSKVNSTGKCQMHEIADFGIKSLAWCLTHHR